MGSFDGKVALVTGGSSGIGLATAHAFVREGAAVVIASRNGDRGEEALRELTAAGGQAAFIRTDVSKADEVEALVRGTVEQFGRIDCAFNNAATVETGSLKRIADFSAEEFDRQLALNLKGVWLCMKYELEQMLRQESGGAIVNTSSVNGLGGVPLGGLYAAAKAGVLGLSKSAALDYAASGIRVNALVPGGFRTSMLEGVFSEMSGGDPAAAGEIAAQVAAMVPLGRIGQPAEAAEAVLWLCSDAASYVTGHSMIVDGGVTAPYR
jgi:NAD(P)-dependent dehydrogenase (short-subunit alcohol dehydrogenase family)